QVVIEGMLGFSYDKPAKHMREYLSILGPLLKGETVSFAGEQFNVNGVALDVPGGANVPVLVAALGPVMLKLAGQLADGTITWMTGPKTLESHIIPNINAGAESVGKPTPKIVAGFPVVLTNDEAGAREAIGKTLQIYGQLPSYRAMLEKEGVAGPAELAFAGDEATIRGKIQQLKDVGVTDFTAAIVATDDGAYERTQAFLASEV
ncbi:MAG: LLM class flavin-dependent oxidoreductase, partial [Pseudomonadales bacterium]|nr:LLM class flavin-dependent oxidoreductase [Pseudomonadales bacterium]